LAIFPISYQTSQLSDHPAINPACYWTIQLLIQPVIRPASLQISKQSDQPAFIPARYRPASYQPSQQPAILTSLLANKPTVDKTSLLSEQHLISLLPLYLASYQTEANSSTEGFRTTIGL
jgi:hypothetical protein